VHGRLVPELGVRRDQFVTREDDRLGELQLQAIAEAVVRCRFTVLIASRAGYWDAMAQFAAGLAQHAGITGGEPRLIVITRDGGAGGPELMLGHDALVGLDCGDEASTAAAIARLRALASLTEPVDERPACQYPGLAPFTFAERGVFWGRRREASNLVQRIACQTQLLVKGPAGSGKSSLIHAAVLPALPADYVVQVVPRGRCLASAVRGVVDRLEVPGLREALDGFAAAVCSGDDARIAAARSGLPGRPEGDARRRVVVVDPLEEVFAEAEDARDEAFALLAGLWSLGWCAVVMCLRADFDALLTFERCWDERAGCEFRVARPRRQDLRDAIIEPARKAGVYIDGALVERLVCEIDRDRSAMALPLLQVVLVALWAQLRWRHLALADYERIVDGNGSGMAAVLAMHANGVLQRLAAGDRVIAQRVLLDLVHLGEGRPPTRRRRAVAELGRRSDGTGQLDCVLDALIAGRLVTVGDRPVDRDDRHVDLAHDALITGWPVLHDWIEQRPALLHKQRQLEARAATGALLTAVELPEAMRWIETTAAPGGELLGASDALRDLVRRSLRDLRRRRRVRQVVIGTGIGFLVALLVQVQLLRQQQAATALARDSSMDALGMLASDVEQEFRKVPGGARLREHLLQRVEEQVTRLRALGELPDSARRIVAIANLARAELALERGQLAAAVGWYREVLTDADRRAAGDPGNPRWQRDLAVTSHKLGDLAIRLGKLDEARVWYDRASAIDEGRADRGTAEWRRDISITYEKHGTLALVTGKLDDARGLFERSRVERAALADEAPNDPDRKRDLVVTYGQLGDLAERTGQGAKASCWFGQGLALSQELAAADVGNALWQLDLAAAQQHQGELADDADRFDAARGWLDQAIAIRTRLSAADPDNTDWRRELALAYKQRGEIAMHATSLDAAREAFEQAIAVGKALVADDPNNATFRSNLAATYERRGEVELRAGKPGGSYDWYAQALVVRRNQAAAEPTSAEYQRDLCAVLLMIAQLAEPAQAGAAYDEARAIYAQLLRDGAFRDDTEFARIRAGLDLIAERGTAGCAGG
jgi:tetratricopeptide (TPR) repeat protein